MMFRLPVLTGAAGALGATYCSPYLTVDGAYHGRPSRQASCLGSSRLLANCQSWMSKCFVEFLHSVLLSMFVNFSIKISAKQQLFIA